MKYQKFIYESFNWDKQAQKAEFNYSFDGHKKYQETLTFETKTDFGCSEIGLNLALRAYFLIAGISYYKAYLSPEIDTTNVRIDGLEADFLNGLFTIGLGQFIYENKLNFSDLARFETDENYQPQPEILAGLNGAIIPLGGGKDSLVTVELALADNLDFKVLRVNTNSWIDKQIKLIGKPSIICERILSQQLLDDNKNDALNGHIPVSAIISSACVIAAVLYGSKEVLFSSEASANEPNLKYQDVQINHQYSKSAEFVKSYSTFLAHSVSPSIIYKSMLAEKGEMEIAKLFSDLAFDKYNGVWSSDNLVNFKQDEKGSKPHWDANSAKTLSTLALLMPYRSRAELEAVFGFSQSPFSEKTLPIWRQLVGTEGNKPFECVGTREEIKSSLQKAALTGEWQEIEDLQLLA